MGMKKDIESFGEQLKFNPEIKNSEGWGSFKNYVLAGMGGSHLQGDVLKAVLPDFPLNLHQDYGLPENMEDTALVIASYSGNTEEVISSFNEAVAKDIPVSVISKGGKLLDMAKEKNIPYIELPQSKIQPRIAFGYAFKGLLKILRIEKEEEEMAMLAEVLQKKGTEMEEKGKKISSLIKDTVPIVYASRRNRVLSSFWKINFNETAKIPSFCNFFPELNHNEMTGFDVNPSTKELSEKMSFLFLSDGDDDSRNGKREKALKDVLTKRGFGVFNIEIEGETRMEKVFSSIILSAWTAYYLAESYGVDPEGVPMVEEFKRMI